jgi:hypothetical protein
MLTKISSNWLSSFRDDDILHIFLAQLHFISVIEGQSGSMS